MSAEDLIASATSGILILVLFVNLTAAILLFKGALRSNYSFIALNERASVAVVTAISSFLLSILGANRLFGWHFSSLVVLAVLSVALVIQALPAFVWLFLYFTHRFREDGVIEDSK